MKSLERGRLSTANRGFGSIRKVEAVSRAAGTASNWPENVSELNDVDGSVAPADGDVLTYDSGLWVPQPPSGGGGGGGSVSDPRWTVPTGWTSIDEFDDGVLHSDWVQAGHGSLPAGAIPSYVEDNGVLSVAYSGAAGDGDTARQHGIVRPLGTALAVGDAVVTSFRTMVRNNSKHRMMGLVLSTTDLPASGNQLYARWWGSGGGTIGTRALTNWGGDTVLGSGFELEYLHPIYQRIIRVSATTWRTEYSPDGVQWIDGGVYTWAFEPTHVGFAHSNWNTTTPSVGSYEFLRRCSGVS